MIIDVEANDKLFSERDLDEVWSDVAGFPNYLVSSFGRVWSDYSMGFLKPYSMNGYHVGVRLSLSGRKYSMYIHQLVANAFVPNPKNLPMIRHLDDDPLNNYFENLAWGTQVQNMRDARENGSFDGKQYVAIRASTVEGVFIGNFKTQHDAARATNVSVPGISLYSRNKRPIKGYLFERIS